MGDSYAKGKDWLREQLGLWEAKFTKVDHADAMVAEVYRLDFNDAPSLILKLCARPGDYHREVYFLRRMQGKITVPQVIEVLQPHKGLPGGILMECLNGKLMCAEEFTGDLAFQVGEALARIHHERTQAYGDLTCPESLSADPFFHFGLKFKEGLEECTDHLSDEVLQDCRTLYNRLRDSVGNVDGPCVVHRDYRAGNLLVQQSQLQGVIDWSSARSG